MTTTRPITCNCVCCCRFRVQVAAWIWDACAQETEPDDLDLMGHVTCPECSQRSPLADAVESDGTGDDDLPAGTWLGPADRPSCGQG